MDIDLGSNSPTGIDLARRINSLNPRTQIIYVSQYIEYVSSVYETEHIYFINKSQLEEYLERALTKATERLDAISQDYLYLQKRQTRYSILQNDILYMERILRVTEIHTSERIFSTSEGLPKLLERLSDSFAICHRSFLVNLRMIKKMTRKEILLWDNTVIPVGRLYYETVKKKFNRSLYRTQADR